MKSGGRDGVIRVVDERSDFSKQFALKRGIFHVYILSMKQTSHVRMIF